jgi:DNA-directed RNA polymerase subunit H (RpoH/RPB5)
VTIENGVVMSNFQSKTLKKTFPQILFGPLAGSGSAVASSPSGHAMGSAYPIVPTKKLDTINDAPVAKASGANARTVVEIITKSAELKDKPVLMRGKVVKYNGGIMGKNWIHLRDGSGSAADETNDILVTSAGETKPGDIVTVKGTVRTDKDFGAGYAYKVLIEEATLQ